MAKDTADNVTGSLFDQTDLETLVEALHIRHKTLQRKANTEQNQAIKKIYQDQIIESAAIINRIQGLKP